VFAGGWTLEAAEAVCAGNDLASEDVVELLVQLVNKSLVVAEDHVDEQRYRLLETLRQYGREKLHEAEEDALFHDRHLAWYAALGHQGDPHTWGPNQLKWFERWDAEVDNLRAALAWSQTEVQPHDATTAGERTDAGLRIGWAAVRFWDTRGFLSEGRRWLAGNLARAPVPTAAKARALNAAAYLALLQGDFAVVPPTLAQAMGTAEQSGDAFSRALAAQILGAVTNAQGDLAAAAALLEQPLPTAAAVGNDLDYYVLTTASLFWRAELAVVQGDHGRAGALLTTALTVEQAQGDGWSKAHALAALGHLALLQGDHERSAALRRESLRLRLELRDRRGLSDSLEGLAWTLSAQGHVERAARLLGAAEATRQMTGFALSAVHPYWAAERDREVTATRASLGEDAFAAAWSEGQAMPLEEAVAYALATDPAPSVAAPTAAAVPGPVERSAGSVLSGREREVAALIAQGRTNREIAERLVISEWTADTHVRHILTKLSFRSRAQVAVWATAQGLVPH
jgi:DNA-binding CsgD family transcriptional regulator/tetratricopeptide (TPR) repeat protein